jgi:hypothetical protein
MVMVSARLTCRWRLSYSHGLTNSAIAAERRLVVACLGVAQSCPEFQFRPSLCPWPGSAFGTMKSDPQAWREIAGPAPKGLATTVAFRGSRGLGLTVP